MPSPTAIKVDPATFAMLLSAFEAIANEMGINLEQSARSTLIREARDASCAILGADGAIVAQAQHTPVQMASLSLPMRACLDKHGPLSEGEAFFTNDPFAGGQHLQDLMVFVPILHEGDLLGFAGTIAHHVDIGGGGAGMTPDAREYYQEGLRFPSTRIHLDRDLGEGGFLRDLVLANFRNPSYALADLQAQVSAARTGAERFLHLVEKYGRDAVEAVMRDGRDYSRRLMAAAISRLSDGMATRSDMVEGGFHSDDDIEVRVTVTVEGEHLIIDFDGTAAQVEEFLNVPFGSTVSSTLSAVKMALDPEGRIPANEGCADPVTIRAPYGSFVNPTPPAATRARMCGAYRIFDAVLDALRDLGVPELPAQGFHVNTTIGFSHTAPDRQRILIEDIGGGWGAGDGHDGADAIDAPLSNCKITPVEAVEQEHPYLIVSSYRLHDESGGRGRWRGGRGMCREFEVLEEGVRFFAYADRHTRGGRGAAAGGDGRPGRFEVLRGDETIPLRSKCEVGLRPGDRVVVVAGGGGGYGAVEGSGGAA